MRIMQLATHTTARAMDELACAPFDKRDVEGRKE